MGVLQVANINFESTGNTQIRHAGSNTVQITAGGSNTFVANSTVVQLSGTTVAANSTTLAVGANVIVSTTAVSVNGNNISPYTGMKNRIINGAMQIWQRSTSAAMTTSASYVAVDRWGVDQATSAAATLSQSTSVPTAIAQYSAKVQRNSSSTGTNNIVIAQALETVNSYDLAGQSVTLSFYAKAGANFSASSNTLYFNIFWGQGTDQSLASMRNNGWTGITNSSSSVTLTTTWTLYTFTASCPAGTTQVGLQFYFSPSGTAGADDAFYITGVQLELGSVATPFERRLYGYELALCQRYYFKTNDVGSVGTTGGPIVGVGSSGNGCIVCGFRLPVQMRTNPTWTFTSFNGTSGVWSNSANNNDTASATINGSSASGFQQVIVSGLTTGQPYYAYGNASAEL